MAFWRQKPRPSGQNGYHRNRAGVALRADRPRGSGKEARGVAAGAMGRPVRRSSEAEAAPGSPSPLGAIAKTPSGGGAGNRARQADANQTDASRDREAGRAGRAGATATLVLPSCADPRDRHAPPHSPLSSPPPPRPLRP